MNQGLLWEHLGSRLCRSLGWGFPVEVQGGEKMADSVLTMLENLGCAALCTWTSGAEGVETTSPVEFLFSFNLHFLHGSLLVLHRGVPEDLFNIC